MRVRSHTTHTHTLTHMGQVNDLVQQSAAWDRARHPNYTHSSLFDTYICSSGVRFAKKKSRKRHPIFGEKE